VKFAGSAVLATHLCIRLTMLDLRFGAIGEILPAS
jgi:hypothetical protein